MASESVKITHVVRSMRGGSQSFLVQGDDGHSYVAKFYGNPQGNRTLINEWIGHFVLTYLQVSVPPLRVLHVTRLTTGKEKLCFKVGSHTFPVSGDVHLGSRLPVDPTSTAIFDFLPTRLLPKVSNLSDFGRIFVVDKWLGQTDTRQAVFVRDRCSLQGLAFKAYLIDNGMLFAGSQWRFSDSSSRGLYIDLSVYADIEMQALCRRTIQELSRITTADLDAAISSSPSSWFTADDRNALKGLLAGLQSRHNRLPELIAGPLAYLSSRGNKSRQPYSSQEVPISKAANGL